MTETYVRPSAMELAEVCDRAPWLSIRYPETLAETRHGSSVDAEVSEWIGESDPPASLLPESKILLAWAAAKFHSIIFYAQSEVTLRSPETGLVITRGTPDLLVMSAFSDVPRHLTIVDWKKSGQWYAGHLSAPDDNLQQLVYLGAAMMEYSATTGQIILAIWDETGVREECSRIYTQSDLWQIIDRAARVKRVDPDGPEPEASKGYHCDKCYSRRHCGAYLLPPGGEIGALEPVRHPEGMTSDEALGVLLWVEQAKAIIKANKELVELAEGAVETHVRQVGPLARDGKVYVCVPTAGRQSGPSVEQCRELGLAHLIKPGKPGEKFDWRKR